jgi:protein PsiE
LSGAFNGNFHGESAVPVGDRSLPVRRGVLSARKSPRTQVRSDRLMEDAKNRLDRLGNTLVGGFQLAALFVIGGTIAWSAGHDYLNMVAAGRARLDDILLLFIYLELGTMVGIYFKTDRLPVLFLLYIAITAMTRFLAVDIKDLTVERMLVVTGSILVLTLAVLVMHVAASRFAAATEDKSSGPSAVVSGGRNREI